MKKALAVVALLMVASCASTRVTGLSPYCTSTGALGVSFGPDHDFDGEITRWAHSENSAFAPFSDIEAVRTRLSGIIHTISGRGSFQGDVLASMAQAERAYTALRTRIEASGEFTTRDVGRYQARYTSNAPRTENRVGLLLSLSGGQVSMTCIKWSYNQQVIDELPDDVRRAYYEARARIEQRSQSEGRDGDP